MITHLCDHRAVVYRDTPTRDELGDTVPVWGALEAPTGMNCRPNQNWSGALQDHGPGEQQGASRQWFLVAEFDVAEGDVLSVEDGPESPKLLRVLSVAKPTAPLAVHHIEVNVEVWHGSLTDGGVTSS